MYIRREKESGVYRVNKSKEIQKTIEDVLSKSSLNRFQIKKAVTFQWVAKNQLSMSLDLHGLNLAETKDIINRLFNTKKLPITVLELVHGYKRGTVLKDYIEKDFNHARLDIARHRISNEGATTLYLKPWNELVKEDNKARVKSKKPSNEARTDKKPAEADRADRSLFQLTMIKEKVKEAKINGPISRETYKACLNQAQIEMMKPLFSIALTKEEFLLRLMNLYVYQATMYVDVNVNKLSLTQVTQLLDKLMILQSDHQVIMSLRHNNKRTDVVQAYIRHTNKDKRMVESHMNEDHTLTRLTMISSKK